MARRSRELREQGRDIIDLSLGEPDHDPPAFALEAAHEALRGPWHKYPPVNGYLDVRQAISNKFERDNGLLYGADQIVVSTGAKQALMNVVMSLIGPGDEVVIPAPYWVSYSEQVRLAGGTPVIVTSTLEEDWKAPDRADRGSHQRAHAPDHVQLAMQPQRLRPDTGRIGSPGRCGPQAPRTST